MRFSVPIIVTSVCLTSFLQAPVAIAFPALNRDKIMKSFNKEKLPPPLVIRDKWAVLIGVSKYQDPNIPPVKSTTANLAVLTKALKDPNAGRFAEDHVTTLFGQQATKKYAEYLLTEGWLIKKALPNDLILVYVCGRGAFTDNDVIVCTYETNAASVEPTGLSLTELLTEIHRRTQSKNIVCVADLAPLKETGTVPADLWKNIANTAKVSILAASQPGQPSYQFNSMGTLCTGYFTDGLQSAGGSVGLEAIAEHVCQSTAADARTQLNREQHPQFVLSPENRELGAVAIGVPIKGNPNAQSRVSIGHPIDTLAMTRPDLLIRTPSHAADPEEGAKEIPRKNAAGQSAETAKSAPHPKEDDDDDDVQDIDYSAYMTKMKKDIQAKWKPPKGLEQRKVAVTFSINRDGSITDGTVVESSGVDAIDQSALAALRDASPIDPLPKGAPKSVQIRYQFDWKVSQ